MDVIVNLWSPLLLAVCALGLLAGMIAGFLPALSPAGALALASFAVVWLTDGFGLQSPVVFMVAFAYGTLYGRALATINLDATAATSGAAIARSERPALIVALLIGVAAAGVLATASRTALVASFGPVELSAMLMFVLLGGAAFGRGSAASALAMIALGLLLGLVGSDIETGSPRLTFGLSALNSGFDVIEIGLGLFVVANAIDDLVRAAYRDKTDAASPKAAGRNLGPATALAVLAGFLPTNGGTFAATVGARRARPNADLLDPAAQRGAAAIIRAAMLSDIRLSVSLIVLFSMAVSVDAITVLLRAPVRFQGMLTKASPDLGAIAWLAGATLVLAHIVPLIVITVLSRAPWRPIRVDARVFAPLIVAVACVVVWQSDDANPAAVAIMLVFGVIGYAMIRSGFDRSLMFFALAIALGLEENIRRSLLIARGDPAVYVQRPISAAFVIGGVLLFVAVRAWRHCRR